MRKMMILLVAVPLLTSPLAAQDVRRFTLGLGYGSHSSYQHAGFLAAQLTYDLTSAWALAPSARRTLDSRADWRVNVVLQRRFGRGPVRPYVGVGLSWTEEDESNQLVRGPWAGVAVIGLDGALASSRWDAGRIRVFGELQGATHPYATGQALVGLRFRFGL